MLLPPVETISPLWIAAAVAGYLLGSVPFGVIFTWLAGLDDIRTIGSGNTGATNVLRTGNRKLAALTLLCDLCKGLAAVLVFSYFAPIAAIIAGFCAFLGHIFPVWLGFRGGKGVATFIGVVAGIAWPCAVIFGLVWLATAFIARYSSLSALVATVIVTVFAFFFLPEAEAKGAITAMAIIIILKHQANIRRLFHGTESKIHLKSR